jgi:hypothetical protein
MRQITCKKCGFSKQASLFCKASKRLKKVRPHYVIGDKRPICKDCHNKTSKKSYKDNIKIKFSTLLNNIKKRNKDINIDLNYLLQLYKEQKGRCMKTGRQFDSSNRLYACSIDRIDNNKGYIKGNIQLVISWYNYSKNSLSDEEHYRLCKEFVEKAKK